MKLATLNDGSRDGQLALVSRDLKSAHLADGIAPTLQAALDDWAFVAPQLEDLSRRLNGGRAARAFDFDPARCMAPLPRAYQWLSGTAYPHHLDLQYRAAGASLPEALAAEPVLHQGGGDDFLAPTAALALPHEEWGIDFEAGLAVVTDDVALGVTPDQAFGHIKLLMLVNGVSLRQLAADELAKGGGLVQSRPAASCSPLAVTPDELDEAWKGGKIHLPLRSSLNGKLVGQPHAGADMGFNFPQLLSHLSKSRRLRAGAIVGTGPVSNKDAKRGYSCIVEQRYRECIKGGAASTPFLRFGDSIRIEMLNGDGKSIFGAIEHTVRQGKPA